MTTVLTPEQVLPHRGGMLLLSRIVSCDAQQLSAEADITRASLFAQGEHGVPRWAGIEFMAQTVAALDGAREVGQGHPVSLGYLLGTRRLDGVDGYFGYGAVLSLRATEVLRSENGLGAYACELNDGARMLRCQLTVYRKPRDEVSS